MKRLAVAVLIGLAGCGGGPRPIVLAENRPAPGAKTFDGRQYPQPGAGYLVNWSWYAVKQDQSRSHPEVTLHSAATPVSKVFFNTYVEGVGDCPTWKAAVHTDARAPNLGMVVEGSVTERRLLDIELNWEGPDPPRACLVLCSGRDLKQETNDLTGDGESAMRYWSTQGDPYGIGFTWDDGSAWAWPDLPLQDREVRSSHSVIYLTKRSERYQFALGTASEVKSNKGIASSGIDGGGLREPNCRWVELTLTPWSEP